MEDWKNIARYAAMLIVGLEFRLSNIVACIHPALDQQFRKDMGVYNDVVVYFNGTSHCASFKCHSIPEDCYRTCLALHDPVTNLLMAASNSLTRHIKQLNLVNGFLNMAMSSPYSNGLYSRRISTQ